jgi:hypothetical protein
MVKTYRGRSKKRHSRMTPSNRSRRGKSKGPRNRNRWWIHLQVIDLLFNINFIKIKVNLQEQKYEKEACDVVEE